MAFQIRPVDNGSWTPFDLLFFGLLSFLLIKLLRPEKIYTTIIIKRNSISEFENIFSGLLPPTL